MIEIKEKEQKPIVTFDKYPDWADDVDKVIINIIANATRAMSINTLKNQYLHKALNFDERVNKIVEKVPGIKLWEQPKPTLQVGTIENYKKAMEEAKEE